MTVSNPGKYMGYEIENEVTQRTNEENCSLFSKPWGKLCLRSP